MPVSEYFVHAWDESNGVVGNPDFMRDLLNFLHTNRNTHAIKIIRPCPEDAVYYDSERKAIPKLKAVFGDNFSDWTAYVGYSAYKIAIPEQVHMSLTDRDHNEKFNGYLYIFILKLCQHDLSRIAFDPIKLLADVGPVLKALHTNNLTHGNIKANNLVDCGRYKLIDYTQLEHNRKITQHKTRLFVTEVMLPKLYLLSKSKQLELDGYNKKTALEMAKKQYSQTNNRYKNIHTIALNQYNLFSKDVKAAFKLNIFKKNDEFAMACVLIECLKKRFAFELSYETQLRIEPLQPVTDKEKHIITTVATVITKLIGPDLYFENLVVGGRKRGSKC